MNELFDSLSHRAFIDSTLAARLNALAGRHLVAASVVSAAARMHSSAPLPSTVQREIDEMSSKAVRGKRGC